MIGVANILVTSFMAAASGSGGVGPTQSSTYEVIEEIIE